MSERYFRLVLGSALLIIVYFDVKLALYTYIGIMFFEGITNLRIPTIISRLRYETWPVPPVNNHYRVNFEAERALRLSIGFSLLISYVFFPEILWFVPWFIGIMLLSAGITNNCPMYAIFKWLGFK